MTSSFSGSFHFVVPDTARQSRREPEALAADEDVLHLLGDGPYLDVAGGGGSM